MLKLTIFLIQILFISVNSLSSQPEKPDIERLQSLASQLYDKHPDSLKHEINKQIKVLVAEVLERTPQGNVAIDTLKFLKALNSENGKFRLVTWAYPCSDAVYTYSGFLQIFNKDGQHDSLITLKYERTKDDVLATLQFNQWPGAVYYRLIEKTFKKEITYTLLGWVGAEEGKEKRVIEILDFDSEGTAYFGSPVFVMDEKMIQDRVIFEYAGEVPLHLNYETHPLPGKKKKVDMIVFNRLVGNNPQMGRIYTAMVPDYSTYDGLIFKDGNWILHRDLDLRVNTDDLNAKPPKAQGLAPSGK